MRSHRLTPEAFAPYGEVFDPAAITGRVDQIATLQNTRPAARPNLFMARTGVTSLPHRFERMESHPYSSQSFMPTSAATLVVGVALSGSDGRPDLGTLRAFVMPSVGFSYRAGVWHLPIAALGSSAPVLGFMYEDGTPLDCVWAEVSPTTLVDG